METSTSQLFLKMNAPLLTTPLSDTEGLPKAYGEDTGVYTEGSTMYVAGTKSLQDVFDDLKIPFGLTALSQRYKDAERTLSAMPQLSRVVGHSLGGAVALELPKSERRRDRNLRSPGVVHHRRRQAPPAGRPSRHV